MTDEDECLTALEVLALLAEHDGGWGWYQIDRALSARGRLNLPIPALLEHLTKRGLIIPIGDPTRAATPYRVTPLGLEELKQ